MKKSKVIKDILKVLKKWENCEMEERTAEAVFNKLDKLGVICPPVIIKKVHGQYYLDHNKNLVPITEVEAMEWDDETSS